MESPVRVVAKKAPGPQGEALSLVIDGVSAPVPTPCTPGDPITVAHDIPSHTLSFRCKRGEVHRLVALGPKQDAYVHCLKDGGRGDTAAFAGVGPIWGEAKVLYGCNTEYRRGVIELMKSRGPEELRKFLGSVWDERLNRGETDPWLEAATALPAGEYEELQKTGCSTSLGQACRIADPSVEKVPLPFLRRLSLCHKRADDVAPCAALVDRLVTNTPTHLLPDLVGDLLLLTADTEQASRAACKIVESKQEGAAKLGAPSAAAWAVVGKRGLSCGKLPAFCGKAFEHPSEKDPKGRPRLYTEAELGSELSQWFAAPPLSKPEGQYGRVFRSKPAGDLVDTSYERAALYAGYRRGPGKGAADGNSPCAEQRK